jgi:hypothetical protein
MLRLLKSRKHVSMWVTKISQIYTKIVKERVPKTLGRRKSNCRGKMWLFAKYYYINGWL